MSIVVTERVESRRLVASRDGKTSTLDLALTVTGTESETLAKSAASAFAPEVWGVGFPQLWKQSVTVEAVHIEGAKSMWLATVHYDTSGPEPLSANDSFEFDTSGGTQRITQSLATRAKYPPSAPSFQGAIGVSDTGVDGVDVVVPVLEFSETHYFPELSPTYKAALVDLTATVNSATFRGRAAGEVLFLGANASKKDNRHDTPWVVTYRFAMQKNRSDFSVGGIAVTSKRGWDYMWIRYGIESDDDSSSLLRVPKAVYIEKVYEDADFSLLGIGT